MKTTVPRRKKDVIAAGADSDQEEEVEEFFGNETAKGQGNDATDFTRAVTNVAKPVEQSPLKKKRIYYYYSLIFEVEFEYDNDTVFFAFSQPYTYTQIMRDLLALE